MFDTTPQLDCAGRVLVLDRPRVMGIVNVTPDSFSDGGRFTDWPSVDAQVDALIAAGAAYVDIGAESTRPGAALIGPDAEWARLEPVLRPLLDKHAALLD